MTAAGYIRLRRLSAGFTVEQVAERLAPRMRDRSEAIALIRMLETDGARARHNATLSALARVFPFDLAVYRQLLDEPADRHPAICRGCGCTHWDPCEDQQRMCGWATPDQCTRCATRDGLGQSS
ncbi:hypothetical protein NDN01_10155 [Sphingomonas sp. QA11]|uniref:hypothetical protein n=1 Tax=Sphingomonas sp. QA11 TaxID=2950605 RepID=UPI00234B9FE3|nr:hypothetical protein [Sphingomonas sp. QA11]WCM29216.1 hypothetical protein NDN01_10155 [Sphingomonas sp. QA11]